MSQTQMHFNSLDAWYNQVIPTLQSREKEVLDAIKKFGKTNLYELEQYFKRGKNTFSGRVTSLKKKNIIKVTGRVRIGQSSYSVIELNSI